MFFFIIRITYIQWSDKNNKNSETYSRPVKAERYFHFKIEDANESKDDESKKEEEIQTSKETDAFLRRKNTLLNKIFRSRVENQPINDEATNEIEIKKENDSKFFEEYIPLDAEPKKNIEVQKKSSKYDPKSSLSSYNGPYSINCLLKVRKSLMESLKPTVYTDRTLEILKLKLNIPSKFDGDRKLMNRLKCKQREYLYDLSQKIRLANKLSGKNFEKNFENKKQNKHTYLKDDDESDDKSFVSDYSYDKNEVKLENKFELCKNSDVFYNLYQESVTNLEDIKAASDDDNDADSKCKQFDKYNKNRKNNKRKNETLNDEIEEMEEKYRKIRDERNKLNKNIRKKNKNQKGTSTSEEKINSKVEMNVKREELVAEMKKIRACLKKLRKNSRHESRKSYKQRKRKDFIK